MATIQRSTTKVANKLLSYTEQRAEITQGVHAPAPYAKAQMKATRELWGKNQGIQAHHIIQSFQPGEVAPDQANKIGQELAATIAPGHEAVVHTHTDKEHTHNHIVINAVNVENGKKYHAHGKEELYKIREASDALCRDHGLSVVQEKSANVRHTLAEQHLLEKGKTSWKDEVREAIDTVKRHTSSLDAFKNDLERVYGVETKIRGKTLSFKHPEQQRFVRASKLGANYEREALERGFERQIGTGQEHERTSERNERTQSADDQLHSGAYERGYSEGFDDREPVGTDPEQQRSDPQSDDVDPEQAEQAARQKQQRLAAGFDRWTENDTREQQPDHRETDGTGDKEPNKADQHERGDEQAHVSHRKQHQKPRHRHQERDGGFSL